MDRLNWYWSRLLDRVPWLTMLAWASVFVLVITSGYLLMLIQRPPVETVSVVDTIEEKNSESQIVVLPELQLVVDAPEFDQVTKAIATLYRLASEHQLNLQEVVYQDQQQQGEPLLRYSVNFTVTQTYPHIKAFVLDMLAAMPYLALEKVQLEREDIKKAQIDAILTFRLFLGRENE